MDATPAAPTGKEVTDRRVAVLRAAMGTFARYGYGRTSMDLVARDAGITRQGLYFLFASKPLLFQEAVELTLRGDLAAAEQALGDTAIPLGTRLVQAFDLWAGRYVGPLTHDVTTVIDNNPNLVGPWVRSAPEQFARLVVDALSRDTDHRSAERIGHTLISASIGIKHQVDSRSAYLQRIRVAVDVLLQTVAGPSAHKP